MSRVRIGTLVVVGVGLIGGSCAAALRRAGVVGTIVGVGRSPANLDDARARGLIDRAWTLASDWTPELREADVVLLAAPVGQYPTLFQAMAPAIGPATVVTDAGSTKGDVAAAARGMLANALARFVPGHPIAGGERSGALAADPALFEGRNVILTPLAETAPASVARVTALWSACGARVSTLTPEHHDRIFAAVSHLPHVLASALVAELAQRPDGATLLAHAGSGFRDFTRIAASSPEMWRDIALANRGPLCDELQRFRDAIDEILRGLAAGDGAALDALFERAAQTRRRWDAQAAPGETV
jgi:prephenate dehydrogenase